MCVTDCASRGPSWRSRAQQRRIFLKVEPWVHVDMISNRGELAAVDCHPLNVETGRRQGACIARGKKP